MDRLLVVFLVVVSDGVDVIRAEVVTVDSVVPAEVVRPGVDAVDVVDEIVFDVVIEVVVVLVSVGVVAPLVVEVDVVFLVVVKADGDVFVVANVEVAFGEEVV